MRPRHAGRVQVVAQRCANSVHFVCSKLFALTTSPKNNAEISFAITNVTTDSGTNRRIVTALSGMGSEINDIMPLIREQLDEVLFQGVASMVGANCN
jgi:hypothetical protein